MAKLNATIPMSPLRLSSIECRARKFDGLSLKSLQIAISAWLLPLETPKTKDLLCVRQCALQSGPLWNPQQANISNQVSLLSLLKEHFGFTSFRPLQEEIIRDALDGRDVVALLPTGGGKSLCFQLPALARTGLTLVVSPLIALMKDQVDALQANGIAATFLNSSLSAQEFQARLRECTVGISVALYGARTTHAP